MTLRNYSSSAAEATLAAGVDAVATTLAVSSTTGLPATPFVLAVDAGAASQELVLVTGVAGTNLTVTRGFDSTVASAHSTGAVVAHSHAAIDFREANAHVNATSGVHGATGSIVGTSDSQTLTNKTIDLTLNTLTGTAAEFSAAVSDDDLATLTGAEVLTNKTLSSSTNVFPWVIQKGSGTHTLVAAQQQSTTVTFPTAFASAPSVTLSVNDERFAFAVKSITTTEFTLAFYYVPGVPTAGGGLGYSWIAVK